MRGLPVFQLRKKKRIENRRMYEIVTLSCSLGPRPHEDDCKRKR